MTAGPWQRLPGRFFWMVIGFGVLAAATPLDGFEKSYLVGSSPKSAAAPIRVRIATELGEILVDLLPDAAPITVANFLAYVDAGRFAEGAVFQRTVRDDNQPNDPIKIDVIQGGPARSSGPRLPPIVLERTGDTGLRHLDGTISMARGGPDTATFGFFICVGDQPELDFGGRRNPDGQGFAAFGRVVAGMDVTRAIHGSPAEAQSLQPPVRILAIERVQQDAASPVLESGK